MSGERRRNFAVVTLTVEVALEQPWGPQFTLRDAQMQAQSEAVKIVSSALGEKGIKTLKTPALVQLVIREEVS